MMIPNVEDDKDAIGHTTRQTCSNCLNKTGCMLDECYVADWVCGWWEGDGKEKMIKEMENDT